MFSWVYKEEEKDTKKKTTSHSVFMSQSESENKRMFHKYASSVHCIIQASVVT